MLKKKSKVDEEKTLKAGPSPDLTKKSNKSGERVSVKKDQTPVSEVSSDDALRNGFELQGSKYKIQKYLGKGGFGITYEGIQTGLNRRVAIKEFFMGEYCTRSSETSQVIFNTSKAEEIVAKYREKFFKEAKTIANLSHPHIVKVIDVFCENNTAYYAMEYISGGSLTTLVENNGPLQEDYAWQIIRQIGEALGYVHQNHILHLDVKPDNIMLRDRNDAVLIDFGVAKKYSDSGHQVTKTPVGISRGYAPLEQYEEGGVSAFSPATDVYSLGATMLYLLTGERPPEAQDIVGRGLPPFPKHISLRTRQAIAAAMQPLAKNRLKSVSEFLSWKEVEEIQDVNKAPRMRFLIEQLEQQGKLKEAYNRCVDCINRGEDLEYAKKKCEQLLPRIRKKNDVRNTLMYLIAFIVIILSLVLPFIISSL